MTDQGASDIAESIVTAARLLGKAYIIVGTLGYSPDARTRAIAALKEPEEDRK